MPKIALLQILVTPGRPDLNFQRAEAAVRNARTDGADIVVLPEAMDFGWTDPSARAGAGAIPGGESCLRLQEMAIKHKVHLCAGLIERGGEKLYNSAVLFGPDGAMLLHHRKINELEIARDLYSVGDRLGVCETVHGRVGLMICADAFAEGQTISRALGEMGARIILSPCAWAVPADHDNEREPYGKLWLDHYGPVARRYRLVIAGASNVGPISAGPWAGRRCIGCSLAVNAEGGKLTQGPYGEQAEAIVAFDVPS